ncbi:hypothetical protein [Plasmodium yoelii yoelii]|uniref:Uncharacterized protein n=1 Tax=Plasmodium yoelii yoelii TaxID=73239 RepID=Q7RJM6_PLAYO|nr:hypothetical protein [Plasmodium yoelii yoelii]
MRGKDNIYAYCFIELCDSYTIKSYICVPFNGKEPNFSVFLTKKNNSKRLNEGAHKYHKSFSKNSTSTFDEEVN